ncbi:MAG: GDSL-type esterase/lipase family protein [Campylobacteraceae bacterium]|nr:GDSL-type esterase/lipase family protein [Campylobacteraceae bacterium]
MSIIKLIILGVIAVFVFNYFNSQDDNFDGVVTLPMNTKILAFGDSLTRGYRVDSDKNYPSVLSDLLQVEVINAGVNGELSKNGLARLPSVLAKYKPDIIIICEGGNDIIQRKILKKTKENIAKMIELAKAKKIQVILVGVPDVEFLTLSTAGFYNELAQKYNIPIDDTSLQEILNDDKLKIDKVHPNAKGYKILSNNLAQIISNSYIPVYKP